MMFQKNGALELIPNANGYLAFWLVAAPDLMSLFLFIITTGGLPVQGNCRLRLLIKT